MSMDIWSYICNIIAFAVYLNTLTAEFVYDDRRAILSNQDVNSNNPFGTLWTNDFWGTPLASSNSHGSYRPLCVVTYRINHWLFGYRAWAYHLTNVVLHTIATSLVLKLAAHLLPRRAARFGVLLFAVHPVHTEAVAGVVGRADVIACIFYILALLCYIRHCDEQNEQTGDRIHYKVKRRTNRICGTLSGGSFDTLMKSSIGSNFVRNNIFLALTILFGGSSMLCKETGFTVLPLCLVYELLLFYRPRNGPRKRTPRWKNVEVLVVSSLSLLVVRVKLSGFHVPTFSTSDNPIAKSDFLTRLFTFLYLPVFNFKLFLFPYALSFDWGMDSVAQICSFFDLRNCLSFTFYYFIHIVVRNGYRQYEYYKLQYVQNKLLLGKAHSNRKPLLKQLVPLFLILLSTMSFLPSSNLFFYVGFVVAERILYIPSVGICLLIGYGYHVITCRLKTRASNLVFASLILVLGLRSVLRNNDWQNEEKLYKSNVAINPPKAYGNLGSVLSDEGRLAEAEVAFRTALKYRFNMADVQYNLAMLLEKTNRPDEAMTSYNLAIKYRPTLAVAYLKLGQLLAKMDREEEAKRLFFLCSRLNNTGLKDPKVHETARIEALANLASIESKNGYYQKALSIYIRAIYSAPHYYKPQALYNFVGETLVKMGKYEEAEKWFRYVTGEVKFERRGFSNLNSFANNSDLQPMEWFSIMEKHGTFNDPYICLQYSQLLFDLKKYRKAVEILKKVINVMPRDYELIKKTARVCRIAGLLAEAEEYYRRVIYLHPDASSYNDLGAILYLRGKYTESETAYKHSLEMNPQDQTIRRILLKLKCILYNKNNSTDSNKTSK